MKSIELEKKLTRIKDELLTASNTEAATIISKEIENTVTVINELIFDRVKGHSRDETLKITEGIFPFKKKKKVSYIADTRIYHYFLSANTKLDYYLLKFNSFPYDKVKITDKDIPILKAVIDDSAAYKKMNHQEQAHPFKEARNGTDLLYPLNIAFFHGDDLQNMLRYSEDTRYRLSTFYDYTNIYKLFYFDFQTTQYREIKGGQPVTFDFMVEDAEFHLKLFPEFGYLYELGRLNLEFGSCKISLIDEKRADLNMQSQISEEEYDDYIRYMMIKFSKYNHDVQQSQIELITDRGYLCPGKRYFLIHADYGLMGLEVSLQKYGADSDFMVWNDKIVEAADILQDIFV